MALTTDPKAVKAAKELIAVNAGGTWASKPFTHAQDAFDYAGEGGHVYREVFTHAEGQQALADPEGLSKPTAPNHGDGTALT